ncbi:MAG: ComF family protein [Bdellovibrionales bacterium]|nr:ComF family protein [Bdellovibrionales bacterium]
MLSFYECFLCRSPASRQTWLCSVCAQELGRHLHPRQAPSIDIDGVPLLSLGDYDGLYARLIKIAKSQPSGQIGTELEAFFRSLVQHWRSEILDLGCSGIVPVPSHPLRAFLQTDLSRHLGQEIARELGLRPLVGLLRPQIKTLLSERGQQKGLSRRDRLAMKAEDKFRIRPKDLRFHDLQPPKQRQAPLLLVDDVCATGASLRAAKYILEESGFRVGAMLVLARSRGENRP